MLDRDPPAGRYEDYHGSQILQLPNQANRRDLPAHLRRIPSWERPFWPIITKGDQIVWVRTFGVAAEFFAGGTEGPTLRIWETQKDGSLNL